MQAAGDIWARHKNSSAFRSIVAQEFDRALQDLSCDVMQDEAEVSHALLNAAVLRITDYVN